MIQQTSPAEVQSTKKTMLSRVEIYTSPYSGFSLHAKLTFNRRNVSYVEYDISTDPALQLEMKLRAGGKTTVPQLFINDEHIGGCDELIILDQINGLNAKLGRSTPVWHQTAV